MKYLVALALSASLLFGGVSYAQSQHQGHAVKAPATDSASTKAYREANTRMHAGMDLRFTNDADVDFIRGMIPHHQGAIDMAKVVLQYGKDEKTRKWAEDIIREQQREIGEMQEWLKKKGQ